MHASLSKDGLEWRHLTVEAFIFLIQELFTHVLVSQSLEQIRSKAGLI